VKLAFIMYQQFGILDLAGPVDVLRGWPSAEMHYVASSIAPVTTDSGMELRPTTTTDQLRDPDVVVVPGTDGPRHRRCRLCRRGPVQAAPIKEDTRTNRTARTACLP
jgi:putative intracellular protease/amidase